MIPRQQTMDDNPLSPSILPGKDEIAIPPCLPKFNGLLLAHNSELLIALSWAIGLELFFKAIYVFSLHYGLRMINGPKSYYRQKPRIASRLRAVLDICTCEMDKVLALMKQWESRPYGKVDDYRNDEDTTMRLRAFLDATESPELTNKIYELKRLSRQLNLVTKALISTEAYKAFDLITTWNIIWKFYLYRFIVSEG